MFRRLDHTLPKDPHFPADLEQLGYCVNEEDQIRSIKHPEDFFQYNITTNARYNDVQREALRDWVRAEVLRRLRSLEILPLHLPLQSRMHQAGPLIPILTSPPHVLRRAQRIVVIVNRHDADLGILSYRELLHERGVARGSMVALVSDLLARPPPAPPVPRVTLTAAPPDLLKSDDDPERVDYGRDDGAGDTLGVVVLNPGQLLFSHARRAAMTHASWAAQPRPSAVHPPAAIDAAWHVVPGHEDSWAHLQTVFARVLSAADVTNAAAQLYVIGIGTGADDMLRLLAEHEEYIPRMAALALVGPAPLYASTSGIARKASPLTTLLRTRARSWVVSGYGANTPLAEATAVTDASEAAADVGEAAADVGETATRGVGAVRADAGVEVEAGVDAATGAAMYGPASGTSHERELFFSPSFSGGDAAHAEGILPAAGGAVVDWFAEVAAGGAGYANGPVEVPAAVLAERAEMERARAEAAGWGPPAEGGE